MCHSELLGVARPPTLSTIHQEVVDLLAAAEAGRRAAESRADVAEARIQEMEKWRQLAVAQIDGAEAKVRAAEARNSELLLSRDTAVREAEARNSELLLSRDTAVREAEARGDQRLLMAMDRLIERPVQRYARPHRSG